MALPDSTDSLGFLAQVNDNSSDASQRPWYVRVPTAAHQLLAPADSTIWLAHISPGPSRDLPDCRAKRLYPGGVSLATAPEFPALADTMIQLAHACPGLGTRLPDC